MIIEIHIDNQEITDIIQHLKDQGVDVTDRMFSLPWRIISSELFRIQSLNDSKRLLESIFDNS